MLNATTRPQPATFELGAELRWCVAERPEVLVLGELQHFEGSGDVPRVRAVEQVLYPAVGGVGATEDRDGLAPQVWPPRLGEMERRDHYAFGIAEGEHAHGLGPCRYVPGHVERYRNGPQRPIGQAHGFAHGVVVGFSEEAAERRERAG